MSALHEGLRKQLEKTVIQAREVAEEGANAALDRLGVGRSRAYEGISKAESDLRVRLRAKGKQLGDVRKSSGEQETRRLVGELAYEYWHRMLFARFLAENDLLMHPDAGVSVSLADCEELAREEGLANGWLLAERWAARMLPEIFRPADPLLQVTFAPEHERALEKLLEALPAETFRASDSLGWVYQFWQARRKEEVNKSGGKIGADELPAVTQLFTEPYMVHFLLDNTLGAWWTARHPGGTPPVAFEYLRLLEDGAPAAGRFDGWPKRLAALKVLDPCCGSGHFLVAAFLKLVPLRMCEEGMSARNACDAVLRDNLHGLEIDPRCTQIAAFSVALAAWSYPEAGGYRPLPELMIACSGVPVRSDLTEWQAIGKESSAAVNGMRRLHGLFARADSLGSLIDPRDHAQSDVFVSGLEELQPLLDIALNSERASDSEHREVAVVARGLTLATSLLSRRYHLVVTNVPYLTRAKQSEILRDYCDEHFPRSRADLATVFLERCIAALENSGTTAVVTPQNWLTLQSYRELRVYHLSHHRLDLIAKLGTGAFRTEMWDFNVCLCVLSRSMASDTHAVSAVDASDARAVSDKGTSILTVPVGRVLQSSLRRNPDARITSEEVVQGELLSLRAHSYQGTTTGDNPRFVRQFWECVLPNQDWERLVTGSTRGDPFGGRDQIIYWADSGKLLSQLPQARVQGREAFGRHGVLIGQMAGLPASRYCGEVFDMNAAAIVPKRAEDLPALWAFCSSPRYAAAVRQIDQKLNVTSATLAKVPFDRDYWAEVSRDMFPAGLPIPSSSDPTQWVFAGHVRGAKGAIQVAVARLLAYRWPDQEADALVVHADRDGIVCLPAVGGERTAADRLRELLADAYGTEWNAATQAELLADAGSPGSSLENWLRDDFFAQHCAVFNQRPFIWHVWDGRRDGFGALVNYHKLDRHTLQTLTYTYLGDWITRQEADAKEGKAGADLRLAAARALQRKLEHILEGEPPYDIFVRWKPIERQPVGWEPDLNDGVRLNIRPFVVADVLRKKPNIKWGKDRGKNPAGAPWGEERFNSYEEHYPDKKLTNAMKLAARAEATRSAGSGT